MKLSLGFKLQQQPTITLQRQQAIRLLQLSTQELEAEIQTLLEKNPLLEYDQPFDLQETVIALSEADKPSHSHVTFDIDDLAWHAMSSRSSSPSFNNSEDVFPGKTTPTLHEHLRWQTDLTHFSEYDTLIAITLIDSISEEGYLSCSLKEIQDTLLSNHAFFFEFAEIEAVLHRIQQFEPLGVGSRDLSECLNVQLNACPANTCLLSEAKLLVAHYLDLLGNRDFSRLKQRLKLSNHDLKAVIHLLMQLNPKPGLQFTSHKKIECIIPDLFVRKKNGHFVVKHNMNALPKLKINPNATALLKGVDKERDALFLKSYHNEAQWFLKSLSHRQSTLIKVAQCIMELQVSFLEKGEEHMKGLVLQEIASKTNLHESTVSRVTTHKYIDTPRGIFELKYFFSNTIHTNSKNSHSSTAIRAHIRKIITDEVPLKPFSDQKITEKLAQLGIQLTRRTVTKYRESLEIPSSHERKILLCNLN
jgi:RNA polymerase sigma-54 factor